MKGNIYGYVRDCGDYCDVARQSAALRDFGVTPGNVFVEKEAADAPVPAYGELVRTLGAGDTLVVADLAVLGGDCCELVDRWRHLTVTKGVGIIALDLQAAEAGMEPAALGRVMARVALGVMQRFDQSRQHKRLKQAEGIAEARRRGVRLGRKPKEVPGEFESVRLKWGRGEISARGAADALNVDPRTFRKWARDGVPAGPGSGEPGIVGESGCGT